MAQALYMDEVRIRSRYVTLQMSSRYICWIYIKYNCIYECSVQGREVQGKIKI